MVNLNFGSILFIEWAVPTCLGQLDEPEMEDALDRGAQSIVYCRCSKRGQWEVNPTVRLAGISRYSCDTWWVSYLSRSFNYSWSRLGEVK